jgi:1-acyl-sn-glycerol-3-phosphate acyltransferase
MDTICGLMKRPEEHLSIGWLRLLDVLYARIYHRVEVLSPCPLPRTGGGILICNHISGLDPVLIQAVCPRLIVWMMAAEYGRISVLRPIFAATRTIYVNRGGQDLAATRQALRVLRSGMILGIFPEGKIETDRNLLPFHPGAAMLAQRAGVPIYPACIDGTSRGQEMPCVFLRRQEIRLRFGASVRLSPDQCTESAAKKVQLAMENLQNITIR